MDTPCIIIISTISGLCLLAGSVLLCICTYSNNNVSPRNEIIIITKEQYDTLPEYEEPPEYNQN
jgi:hypothetical protein